MEPGGLRLRQARRVGRLVRRTSSRGCSRRAAPSTATSPTATGRTSARSRATSRPRPTSWRAGSTSTSTGSRSHRGSGSPRAPTSTRRPCCAARCSSGTTPRSRPAPSCASTRCSAATSWCGTGAFLHRAVVHDNVFIGQQANLRGCVIGKNTDIMRAAQDRGGRGRSATSASSRRRPSSPRGCKVYPFKTIEAGAVVHSSVIWESRGQRNLFGAARGLRHRQRRDHPRAGGAARLRLRDDAAQGRDRRDVAATTPGPPGRSSGP